MDKNSEISPPPHPKNQMSSLGSEVRGAKEGWTKTLALAYGRSIQTMFPRGSCQSLKYPTSGRRAAGPKDPWGGGVFLLEK